MPDNQNSENVADIFRLALEEAKKKKESSDKEEKDADKEQEDEEEKGEEKSFPSDDKNKDIDGDEDGEEEEKAETKKVKADVKNDKKKKKFPFVKEETVAASSLHPAAKSVSDDKAISTSKIKTLQNIVHLANTLDSSEWTAMYDKVISQFGPNKTYGVGDNSEKNKKSIENGKLGLSAGKQGASSKEPMPKLNVKEDIDAIFDGQDLSEEFKDNVSTLFEAALSVRMEYEVARLEEENELAFVEGIDVFKEELTTKIDDFLNFVVEGWITENEVAIESALRNELMEEFIGGLKNLFKEHYINVPDDKVDVIEQLAKTIKELENTLSETIQENANLKNALVEDSAKSVFEELASDLAVSQAEKFATLAEGIEFDGDIDTYTKKLSLIKDTYFTKTVTASSNINEEVFEGEIENKPTSHDPEIDRYVRAISRTVKNY